MTKVLFSVESVSKAFNRRIIFESISFALKEGESLAITGKNGSGKSTLAKILCGLLSPTKGNVRLAVDGASISSEDIFQHIGLVSPYINMYDEFSGLENLMMIGRIRNLAPEFADEAAELLKRFGIFDRSSDEVRTYSSGMKQRLKYAAALLHHPQILVLDEPTANLDEQGIGVVRETMRSHVGGGVLIIATNEKDDLAYAGSRIDLDRKS